MNKVNDSSSKDIHFRCLEDCVSTVTDVLSITICIVAHPIIGAAGSIGCLFAAAYHGVLSNHHWRHTREKDEKGNLIPGTELHLGGENKPIYMNKDATFKSSDLIRLQNEVKRVYHSKKAAKYLDWARGLGKYAVPLIGPIWALSELKLGASLEEDRSWMTFPEERLGKHIAKLEKMSIFS
jgi:hypothetical protein